MIPENQKLAELLKKFRPEFGNQGHIEIGNMLRDADDLRRRLSKREENAAELQKELKDIDGAEDKIRRKERQIIFILEKELFPKQ